jgi:hypothetical protein
MESERSNPQELVENEFIKMHEQDSNDLALINQVIDFIKADESKSDS